MSLTSFINSALGTFQNVDPINSAIFNGMIDVDTEGIQGVMGGIGDIGEATGWSDLESFGDHWQGMAKKDQQNHGRAIGNAALTIAALYGGAYGAGAGAGTAGGAAASGASGSAALTAARGGSQSDVIRSAAIGGAAGGAGQAVGSYTGSSLAGGAAGGAVSSGLNGGSVLQGAVGGALGSGAASYDLAGAAGVEDEGWRSFLNNTASGTLSGMARGGSFGDSLEGGAVNSIPGGLNSLFGNYAYNNSMGSGGDMSNVSDVTPNSYDENSSNYRYDAPSMQIASAGGNGESSGFNLGNLFNGIGNSIASNPGDFAALLYGIYSNRKQQKMIGRTRDSLANLYGPDSAYAKQLRAKLNAQAAQRGTRANTAGRETQLMAALADRAASTTPYLNQLDMARGELQNQFGANLLNSFGKMGGWDGIRSLFPQRQTASAPSINIPEVSQNASPNYGSFADYIKRRGY